MDTIGTAELAELLELTPRRLQQLAAEGVLPKDGRGQYQLKPAIQGYVRFLRDQRDGEDEDGGDSWQAQRTRKAREQADRLAMENAAMRGELLPRGDVHAAVTSAFARVRAKCLGLPAKLAPLLAQKPPAAIKERLTLAVNEALAELAGTTIAGLPPSDGSQSDGAGGGAGVVADPGAAAGADAEPVGGPGKVAKPRGKRRAR